jgi:hypothetical protein
VFGKQVIVQYNDLDRCSRVFGKVIVNGQDAKLRQVSAGLAWHYKYYQSDHSPADRQAYSTAEIQARKAKLGLWADAHPVPPCDWRRGERAATANTPSLTANDGCSPRRTCDEMTSCDEVERYVRQCGPNGLDGDGNRVSCETCAASNCKPQAT